jgi:hypothetical protein
MLAKRFATSILPTRGPCKMGAKCGKYQWAKPPSFGTDPGPGSLVPETVRASENGSSTRSAHSRAQDSVRNARNRQQPVDRQPQMSPLVPVLLVALGLAQAASARSEEAHPAWSELADYVDSAHEGQGKGSVGTLQRNCMCSAQQSHRHGSHGNDAWPVACCA